MHVRRGRGAAGSCDGEEVSGPANTHPLDIVQSLDDEHQSLSVVAHPTEEEDHFGHEVLLLADLEGLEDGAGWEGGHGRSCIRS